MPGAKSPLQTSEQKSPQNGDSSRSSVTQEKLTTPSEAISSLRAQLPVPQWLISIELVKRFLAGWGFWVWELRVEGHIRRLRKG